MTSSSSANHFKDVEVSAGDFGDEGEFLRILLHFESLEKISDDELDAITSAIEGAVAKQDDRFPSVRFSDS